MVLCQVVKKARIFVRGLCETLIGSPSPVSSQGIIALLEYQPTQLWSQIPPEIKRVIPAGMNPTQVECSLVFMVLG